MTAWRREQARDRFFRQAKRESYRARSAYKLLELNRRFGLFKPGDAVLDLGAAPGSWSQVAAQVVGPRGRVVAVDLSPIEPLEGVATLQADILDPAGLIEMRAALGRPADAVVSDVSPRVSGNRLADQARSIELALGSLEVAAELSRPGSSFAVKLFRGEDFDGFVERVGQAYRRARVAVPEATRSESREAYVLGLARL
ncbi:MAG TPA: RlmE family RNA methyltransferase [Chloroflexota bacterium]